jgi:hypothetical protein
MKEGIKKFENFISKNTIEQKVKDQILNGWEFSDWINAIRLQYGNIVPLYHATTEETAELIDEYGFKLTFGKNYKSSQKFKLIYFQLGKSDYVASNRSILYRVDVPIEFIERYCEVDMDNVRVSNEELSQYVDLEEFDTIESEMRDAILYFIWNNFKLEGTELLASDRDNPDNEDIFMGLKPYRVI